jgi:ERF superfamily protein
LGSYNELVARAISKPKETRKAKLTVLALSKDLNEVTIMTPSLDYKNNFLCVLAQYEVLHGHAETLVKEWYPVRQADDAEVATLLGRSLKEVDSDEGMYVDEEGNMFQLAEKGGTRAIEVERSSAERKERSTGQTVVSPDEKEAPEKIDALAGKAKREVRLKTRKIGRAVRNGSFRDHGTHRNGPEEAVPHGVSPEPITFAQLNLRQKLAVVRRRLIYVQKRGYNQRNNYNYVTAADIAGAVGDILAELGVVVVPRLESISHEATRSQGRTEAEHVARVIMSYSFVDVDTAEEITVKTAGEGLDTGGKAPLQGHDRSFEVCPAPIVPARNWRRSRG